MVKNNGFQYTKGVRHTMKTFAILAIALALVSCATNRSSMLQQGMLELDQEKSEFLVEWGKPTRQYTTSSEEMLSAGWGPSGGGFFKGRRTLEVWVYEGRRTELVFDDDDLVAWKTEATVQELAKPGH